MTNKETVKLVLREVQDKFDGTLPPCVPNDEAGNHVKTRHGILMLATGLVAALYSREFNDGVDTSVLWDAGVAQEYEQWAAERVFARYKTARQYDEEVPPPDAETMFQRLEDYFKRH